jgi:phenylpropionate dioxygenase-like ring-hydroxylating dioxygenase large terminal subunit
MQTTRLADDPVVAQRILDHIDNKTTDLGDATWREPVENYLSQPRFDAEREILRRYPVAFCPSAALPSPGSYLARDAAGIPVVAVRDGNGEVRAFRNACRHRGTQVVNGTGCEKALICRYHGWTYGLDGRLRHVPDEHGFPGLDKSARGLVPVSAVERNGVVFVTQNSSAAGASPEQLPPLIGPEFRLLVSAENDVPANWKIVVEGFLEGYHIRSTHAETFFPVQYDNLNVVETFGRNSRVAYPFRNINKLRKLPPEERSVDGTLTFVYHLFPNVMVATFPGRIFMVALEPLALDRTRFVTYVMSNQDLSDEAAQTQLKQGAAFVDAGAAEDREMACAIQRSLSSGANEFLEFGLFDAAIVHFHRALDAALEEKS